MVETPTITPKPVQFAARRFSAQQIIIILLEILLLIGIVGYAGVAMFGPHGTFAGNIGIGSVSLIILGPVILILAVSRLAAMWLTAKRKNSVRGLYIVTVLFGIIWFISSYADITATIVTHLIPGVLFVIPLVELALFQTIADRS